MSRKQKICPNTGNKITHFQHRWGIHAVELANEEMVKPEALHMRIKLFGSPFQRMPIPSIPEIMYGKTKFQLAEETNIHPGSLMHRLINTGDAYYESNYQHTAGMNFGGDDWRDRKAAVKPQGWLSPRHPAYTTWRVTVIKHVLEGDTIGVAVEKMLNGGEISDGK